MNRTHSFIDMRPCPQARDLCLFLGSARHRDCFHVWPTTARANRLAYFGTRTKNSQDATKSIRDYVHSDSKGFRTAFAAQEHELLESRGWHLILHEAAKYSEQARVRKGPLPSRPNSTYVRRPRGAQCRELTLRLACEEGISSRQDNKQDVTRDGDHAKA